MPLVGTFTREDGQAHVRKLYSHNLSSLLIFIKHLSKLSNQFFLPSTTALQSGSSSSFYFGIKADLVLSISLV